MKKLTKRTISFVLVLAMLIGMAPLWAFAVEPGSDVLLEETYTVSGSSAFKYWEVDFKAGEVYTITASWHDAPAVSPTVNNEVKSAWKVSTVGSSTSTNAIDTIFLASIKKGSLTSNYAVKGYQGVFVPTQDTSWMNLYFNYFNCVGNVFSIKVEKGNKLGTSVAAGQELVYDAYIDVGANTTYLHGFSSLALEANVPYTVSVNWDSTPVYAQQTGGSAWKISAASTFNDEAACKEMLKALNNQSDDARKSGTGTVTKAEAYSYLNFFVQRFGASGNRAHVTITKPAPAAPDNGLTISILGDSISTYTGISSGAAASTTNSTIGNNDVYYTAGRFDVYQADTWWQQAADALGAKVLVNNAWSGSCVYQTRSGTVGAYADRCVQLHDDTGANSGEKPDIIAVYLGTNDYRLYPETLGTVDAINSALITQNGSDYIYATPVTTAEAYDIMLHKATRAYPDAEIYCFTVLNRTGLTPAEAANLSAMNDIIRSLAQKYGAYLVDLYNNSGIGDNAFFQTYIPNDSGNLVHPGPNGMDAITNCFLSAVYANSEIADIDNDTTYSVSYDLTDTAIKQGTAKTVPGGKSFTCDLITKTGYTMDVEVTMGGTDITSTAYANGKITLDSVSGDIVIKAEGKAAQASAPQLNTPVTVGAGSSTVTYDYTFQAGKAYKITLNWDGAPSFTGAWAGYILQTTDKQNAGDLIIKSTGKSTSATSKAVKGATGVFIATQDMSALQLSVSGLNDPKSVTVNVEPAAAELGVMLDMSLSFDAGTAYSNNFFALDLVKDKKYDVTAEWATVPTYSGVSTAWKLQPTENATTDGHAAQQFAWRKITVTSEELRNGSAAVTCNYDASHLNFFTQGLSGANTMHIVIRDPDADELNQTVNVTTTDTAEEIVYNFEKDKAYKVTATWASDPSFPSGKKGWSLTTGTTAADGDLVVKAFTGGTFGEKVASSATVIFTATENATKLYLDAAGITADNTVTITVEPATAEADTLVDMTVTLPAGTRYTNVYTDAVFTANEKYDYSVQWTNQPTHSTNDVRAWKIQPATDSSVDGSGGDWYVGPKSASGVSTQTATGTQTSTVDKPVFNLFTQYLEDENTVHITLKKVENAVIQLPYDILDEVEIVKSISIATNANGKCTNGAGCTTSHPMQAFDVYDGVVFASYDGGYVITYDLETGAKLSEFLMGCGEFSHAHHCGNAMFGTAKFDPNDRFPLFYSSGDLSTKDCYVERIITDSNGIPVGSEMIQRIDFDMGQYAGANGAQAVVDPANNRIIFQQRKTSSIGNLDNAFVMGEYPLPAHTEGTLQADGSLLVQYDTSDFLCAAYELPYWSSYYQGADYYNDLFLQTHGLSSAYANSFGSANGVMVFDYTTPGHDFTRYIPMTPVVGVNEPQGISVCDGKLYVSYSGKVHEVKVKLGVKETGYDIATAMDDDGIKTFVETAVTSQLTEGGKGYTLQSVELKTLTATGFTADVTVKTPYTVQTFTVSGGLNGYVPTPEVDEAITMNTGDDAVIIKGENGTELDIRAGKTYQVTVSWENAPSFNGSAMGYQLETASETASGDLVVKSIKKDASGSAIINSYYQGTFTATEDMPYLKLSTTALAAVNNVTVSIEEVTLPTDVIYEATIRLDNDIPWLNLWAALDMAKDSWYEVDLSYATVPTYTSGNEGKTAWKIQGTTDTTTIGNVDVFYTHTAANGTGNQNFSQVIQAGQEDVAVNFFTQRTTGSNTVTIRIKNAEEPQITVPYEVEDIVTVNKLLDVPGSTSICINDPDGTNGTNCTEGHPMQAFDIYDGVIFVTYDGGYVMTFDLETGEKISEWLMGCAISHEHHCGNAMFGTAKFDPDDRFPLLYSSGDLSTKACYVERILTDENGKPIGSELIQWINFDMGQYAGANGAQAVVDPGNDRILFQMRKLGNISDPANSWVVGEYPLPAPTEGTLTRNGGLEYLVVNLDTDDFLVPAYELPYYGPLYQGADYYEDQLLQTYGPVKPLWERSVTGLMTFDMSGSEHTFTRFIDLSELVGSYEPQSVAVWDGKLYISYYAPGACIFEVEVVLGIDTTGNYAVPSAKDDANLAGQIAAMVNKQLADAGKDYTVSEVKIKTNDNGAFTADVTVKTPYTFQTVSVSGTVGDHSFTNYVNDDNATCTEDGTKTAACDHEGCTATDVVVLTGTKLDHSFTDYVSDGNATCTEDGTKTAECDRGCGETDTIKEAAHGHKLTKVAGKAATCTENGVAEHYNCSVCHKNFSDAEGKTEVSSVVIAAGHTLAKVDGKAPTETENGHKEHYGCTSCGKLYADAEGKTEVTKDSIVISATGAPSDTGDSFSAAPVLLMMLLSAMAMAVLVIKRKEF